MDQELAKELFFGGGILMFLDVPEGTEFGVDLKSWTVGEKFRGLKMIPPGIHFIFFNAVDKDNSMQFRTGFFHDFKKGQILVRKWDKNLETISAESASDREVASFGENITLFDQFLGPYPYDLLDKWKSLTLHISDRLIKKLSPTCGLIKAMPELVSLNSGSKQYNCTALSDMAGSSLEKIENNLVPHLVEEESSKMRLTPYPEKNFPADATPAEITKHSLDSTFVLDVLISKHDNLFDILGELEFCYICFLVGQNYQAFEHWKKLFGTFCSSAVAVQKYETIYYALLSLIEIQIMDIPEDFFVDIVENNNYIYIKLRNLFGNIFTENVNQGLQNKALNVRSSITDRFGWEFDHLDSDEDDEAPVIVET